MDKKIPAISVVIPMYNAEKFIAPCLESLMAQSFKDFEVVVVDDCSTDNSCGIVESYVRKFTGGGQSLHLIRSRENFGNPGVPRNKGLNASRGKYIFFMDNDDLLMGNALEKFYQAAENSGAEVVYTHRNFVFDKDADAPFPKDLKILTRIPSAPERPFFAPENPLERIFRFGVEPWLKFSRRDFLVENEIYFPRIYSDEDDFWTTDLVLGAKKILIIPDPLYVNREIVGSITRSKKSAADIIKFYMYFVIFGPENIKRIADKHAVLRDNPQICYSWMTGDFMKFGFGKIFDACASLQPYEVYRIFQEQFAEEIGDHAELISCLCSYINTQQKMLAVANARISELERKLTESKS